MARPEHAVLYGLTSDAAKLVRGIADGNVDTAEDASPVPIPTTYIQCGESDAVATKTVSVLRGIFGDYRDRGPFRVIARSSEVAGKFQDTVGDAARVEHFSDDFHWFGFPEFGFDLWHRGAQLAFTMHRDMAPNDPGDRWDRIALPRKLALAPFGGGSRGGCFAPVGFGFDDGREDW